MRLEELCEISAEGEEIEYHCMGVEQHAALLPGPGWYRCRVERIYPSGNIEIALTGEEVDGFYVTVLKKNIEIAFRRVKGNEDV